MMLGRKSIGRLGKGRRRFASMYAEGGVEILPNKGIRVAAGRLKAEPYLEIYVSIEMITYLHTRQRGVRLTIHHHPESCNYL